MTDKTTLKILSLTAFAAACALALIWTPYGTTMLGVIEEWGLLGAFVENGPTFVVGPDTPFAFLQLRPLNLMPQALAYVLTPNSFLGWHVLQWLGLIAKAVAMSYIILWLLRSRWMAAFAGLVFMLFPADTMQISLRSLHINWAVALSLSGVALLLASTALRSGVGRAIVAFSGGALFLLGSLTYEAGLFLAPLPLLLWWCRFGLREGLTLLKQQIIPVLVWTVTVCLAAGYLVIVGRSGAIYQSQISSDPIATLQIIANRIPLLFEVGLYRVVLHSWFDAARMLWAQGWQGTVAVAVAIFVVLSIMSSRAPSPNLLGGAKVHLRLLIIGILAAALGYAPYLSSLSHIFITQRTYMYAAVGGTLIAVSLLCALSIWRRPVGATVGIVLLALGFVAQGEQMAHYVDLSNKHRALLSSLLEVSTSVAPNQRMLIIDQSGYLGNTWMLKGELLGSAMTYLKQRSFIPEICLEPSGTWSSFKTDVNGGVGRCVEHETYWDIGGNIGSGYKLKKTNLVQVVIDPDGKASLVGSNVAPASPTSHESSRWRAILGCWPASTCAYADVPATSSFHYDFGDWWSMEQAPWGAGWRDAEWTVPALAPSSIAWMNAPASQLWFRVTPTNLPYVVRVRVAAAVSAAAQEGFAIAVNGKPLSLVQREPQVWEAELAPGLLTPGRNGITLSAPLDPTHGISLAIDWVDVSPLSTSSQ